jgi:hypothetical protein
MSGLSLIFAAIVAGLLVVGILLALVLWKRRKEGKVEEPDYRAFFVMGLTWFPAGVVLMIVYFVSDIPFVIGMPLFAMGLVYLAIGLANRDKWKKSE